MRSFDSTQPFCGIGVEHLSVSQAIDGGVKEVARYYRRAALVCHPDKCPDSLSESATELFRFVQSIRSEKERGE